jgi:hypothetical protein
MNDEEMTYNADNNIKYHWKPPGSRSTPYLHLPGKKTQPLNYPSVPDIPLPSSNSIYLPNVSISRTRPHWRHANISTTKHLTILSKENDFINHNGLISVDPYSLVFNDLKNR